MGRRKHEGTAAVDATAKRSSTLDELGDSIPRLRSRVLSPTEIHESHIQGRREYGLILFIKWPNLQPGDFCAQLRHLADLDKQVPLRTVPPRALLTLRVAVKVAGMHFPDSGALFRSLGVVVDKDYFPNSSGLFRDTSGDSADRDIEDFGALFHDLSRSVDKHKRRLIQYAGRRYGYPLLEGDQCISSEVVFLALAIAMVEFYRRLDDAVVKAHLRLIAEGNREIGQVRVRIVKQLGLECETLRSLDQDEGKRQAMLAPFVKGRRRRGRPPCCKDELRNLFMVAGLSPEVAERHANDLTQRIAQVRDPARTLRLEATKREHILIRAVLNAREAARRAGIHHPDPVAVFYYLAEVGQQTLEPEIEAQELHRLPVTELRKRLRV